MKAGHVLVISTGMKPLFPVSTENTLGYIFPSRGEAWKQTTIKTTFDEASAKWSNVNNAKYYLIMNQVIRFIIINNIMFIH
jgi:hypothetical protein